MPSMWETNNTYTYLLGLVGCGEFKALQIHSSEHCGIIQIWKYKEKEFDWFVVLSANNQTKQRNRERESLKVEIWNWMNTGGG